MTLDKPKKVDEEPEPERGGELFLGDVALARGLINLEDFEDLGA